MAGPCEFLSNEVEDLVKEIAELQQQLGTATPSEKSDIVALIRRERAELGHVSFLLHRCEAWSKDHVSN
jgi:hypothetical protein